MELFVPPGGGCELARFKSYLLFRGRIWGRRWSTRKFPISLTSVLVSSPRIKSGERNDTSQGPLVDLSHGPGA